MKILRAACSLVLCGVLLLQSGCSGRLKKYTEAFFGSFDTVITITAYCRSQDEFTRLYQMTEVKIMGLHRLFDVYNDYDGINNIKTINDNAGTSPVKVSAEIIDLLRFAKEWHGKTNGAVNVAMGSVLKVWKDYRDKSDSDAEYNDLPTVGELQAAALHTNINDIIINDGNSTVFLRDKEMSLDVGALAKGFAAEHVAKELEAAGFMYYALSMGGNVRVGAFPPGLGRQGYNIAVMKPDDKVNEALRTIEGANVAVVTSGDYQRYFSSDGVKYCHIIDPVTLFPANGLKAVTVLTGDSAVCDALSTALFIIPYDDGIKLLNEAGGEAIYVMPDGSVHETEGMGRYYK